MPTYDYRCDACGHEFEEFQSITAKPLRKCPSCGKNKLNRLIGTGAAVIFKGSGFWQTDYRSESYKQAAKADAEAAKGTSESKGESKDGSKSENAPADAGAAPSKAASPAKSNGDAKPKAEKSKAAKPKKKD